MSTKGGTKPNLYLACQKGRLALFLPPSVTPLIFASTFYEKTIIKL